MNGMKINKRQAQEMLEQINRGESDSAVISLMIGGTGLNCQRMNAVIHMAPCFQAALERQANGTS
jgi:SNF2 family DNA or RNA helicase